MHLHLLLFLWCDWLLLTYILVLNFVPKDLPVEVGAASICPFWNDFFFFNIDDYDDYTGEDTHCLFIVLNYIPPDWL